MCIYVYMCTFRSTYMCSYRDIDQYIHFYMCQGVYIYKYTHMSTHNCSYMHMCTYVYRIHIHTYVYMCISACVYTCLYMLYVCRPRRECLSPRPQRVLRPRRGLIAPTAESAYWHVIVRGTRRAWHAIVRCVQCPGFGHNR